MSSGHLSSLPSCNILSSHFIKSPLICLIGLIIIFFSFLGILSTPSYQILLPNQPEPKRHRFAEQEAKKQRRSGLPPAASTRAARTTVVLFRWSPFSCVYFLARKPCTVLCFSLRSNEELNMSTQICRYQLVELIKVFQNYYQRVELE